MKLEGWHSSEAKRGFKIIRTDYTSDPIIDDPKSYEIIAADEDTGECILKVGGESKTLGFGPRGIRIIARSPKEM